MSLQTINLGTPNNNDGDSLYAGGNKINTNFAELYTALAGNVTNTLRIDLGSAPDTAPTTGSVLTWSAINQKFIAGSGSALRSSGAQGSSALILTNDLGYYGIDNQYRSRPNSIDLFINGRPMWDFRATTTGSLSGTRGTLYIGLGNAAVTSLAITTRGVTISGVDGLTVWKNSTEESINSSQLIGTGSSGVILYQSPLLSTASQKGPTDSSNSIAHTGYVQQAITARGFAAGNTNLSGNRGVIGGGTLSADRTFQMDPRTLYNLCNGLTYQFQLDAAAPNGATSVIVVHPGTAVHFSYSTTGATQVATTSVQSIVTVNQSMARAWLDTAWASTNTSALLEAGVSNADLTWYYVYLIVNTSSSQPDFCVSTSRSYAAVATKLAAATGGSNYAVVRRLGTFRTGLAGTGIQPFTTRRVDNNTIQFQYGNFGFSANMQSSSYTSSIFVFTGSQGINTQGIFTSSQATTATASLFSSTLVRAIPPIPGITADIDVYHNAGNGVSTTAMTVIFYGEPWLSSTATMVYAIAGTGVPYQVVKHDTAGTVNTSRVTTSVAMAPDLAYVSDAALDVNTVFGSTSGSILRVGLFNLQMTSVPTATPQHLGWDVRGFKIAR
jgi:hypothetical protein